MIHIHSSIDIDVAPDAVFDLLCDPERKTALNPKVVVLKARRETAGPVGPGTEFFYSLGGDWGAKSFRCRVTAFAADRMIEVVSDTNPPFRVRQTLEPTLTGCRLVHEEWLDLAPRQAQRAAQENPLFYTLKLLQRAAGLTLPTAHELDLAADDTLTRQMQCDLAVWLGNIKASLEAEKRASATADDFAVMTA